LTVLADAGGQGFFAEDTRKMKKGVDRIGKDVYHNTSR
jgi:hypothetical protein